MKLTSVTEVYSQEEDCCGRINDIGQQIELSTCDGGGGSYLIIKTERWAVDSIEDLAGPMKMLLERIREAEKK